MKKKNSFIEFVSDYTTWAQSRKSKTGRYAACSAPLIFAMFGAALVLIPSTPPPEVAANNKPLATTEILEPPVPASTPAPLSANEQLKADIISNTPGLFAQEKLGFIPADKLANEVLSLACDLVESFSLEEAQVYLADAARKQWQADEAMATNIAKGLIDTAVEPGRCAVD